MNNAPKQPVRTGVTQDFERVMDLVEMMQGLAARYKDYATTLRELQGRVS